MLQIMFKRQIKSATLVFLLIIRGAIPAVCTPGWAPQSPIFSAEDHIDEVVEAVRCFDKLKLARDVHLVDLFGGHGALSKAWSKNRHGTILFDTAASGEDHNIISRDGFFRALGYTLRLVKGGRLQEVHHAVSSCGSAAPYIRGPKKIVKGTRPTRK